MKAKELNERLAIGVERKQVFQLLDEVCERLSAIEEKLNESPVLSADDLAIVFRWLEKNMPKVFEKLNLKGCENEGIFFDSV